MAFRLVSSGGSITDPAVVNLYASGTIHPGGVVDFIRTSGFPIGPATLSSTQTMVFGIAKDYTQGKSDYQVGVIPITSAQLWEADCANAASTAQVGIRHALGSSELVVHNTATDVTGFTGVFLALAMSSSTSGSGKLIGKFLTQTGLPVFTSGTTFV